MATEVTFLLDAPAADAETSWVQVAKTGKFTDPRYGNFSITAKDFDRWIRNFDANIGHGELGLPVDIDHSPEKRGDTEAVGWIKQLEKRSDQLWARVEWNTLGKELVGERRYAYISPSYSNNYQDESGTAHGTALVGIALTNRPFLKMATVNLSQFTFAKGGGDNKGLVPEDITDLDSMDFDGDDDDGNSPSAPDEYTEGHGLDDLMLSISDAARQKHAVVVKKVNGETKHMFPIPPGDKGHARAALRLLPRATKAGHITSQEAGAIRQRAAEALGTKSTSTASGGRQHDAYSLDQMELDQYIEAMDLSRETLGVAADADEATVLTALKDYQAKPATGEPKPTTESVTLSNDQLTTLLADAAAGRAASEELRVSRFDGAFTTAQREGKVTLSQRETFKTIFDQNPDTALKLLDELQPSINMTPQGAGGQPTDLDAASAQLASEFTDTVTPRGMDTDALRLHSAATALERARNISYEDALQLAESGVTA